jgi:hypothetical protein
MSRSIVSGELYLTSELTASSANDRSLELSWREDAKGPPGYARPLKAGPRRTGLCGSPDSGSLLPTGRDKALCSHDTTSPQHTTSHLTRGQLVRCSGKSCFVGTAASFWLHGRDTVIHDMGHCSSNLVDLLPRAAIPSPSMESSKGGPKTALDMGQKDLI